jgi:hypothetical protein
MRLSKKAWLRICLYIAVGTLALWVYPSSRYRIAVALNQAVISLLGGDLLDRTMRKLVPDSVDCGRVRIGSDPEPATRCALAAFHHRHAFRVRYDMQGIDSDVAVGFAGTTGGSVTVLPFDGDPAGQAGTSILRQRVSQKACPTPVVLFRSPKGRLSCFESHPIATGDPMSPTFEEY